MAQLESVRPAQAPIEVIKGNLTPLSPQQRELVSIFVEYLRHLPKWDDEHSWHSNDYQPINRILATHYRRKYPDLPVKSVAELPERDCDKFEELMELASSASAEDPRVRRGGELLRLLVHKRKLVSSARQYEAECVRLGIEPEAFFTPLSLAAPTERKVNRRNGEAKSAAPKGEMESALITKENIHVKHST